MKIETITIENPSQKLLEFCRKLRDDQTKKIKGLKEKFKNYDFKKTDTIR